MTRPAPDLRQCKSEAKRLLAALHSDDDAVFRTAAERFRATPLWRSKTIDDIRPDRAAIQLKHAQAVIAREQKFADWKSLKDATDVVWYPFGGSAFLNAWFAQYANARACLDKNGGYLLTHRGQYFVCEADFIRALGIDPKDPRWEAIGRDTARPLNRRACNELRALAKVKAKEPREALKTPDPAHWPGWARP